MLSVEEKTDCLHFVAISLYLCTYQHALLSSFKCCVLCQLGVRLSKSQCQHIYCSSPSSDSVLSLLSQTSFIVVAMCVRCGNCFRGVIKKLKCPSLGWIVVFGGVLINFTLGIDNTIGNMVPYIISYTRQRSLDPYREVVSLNYAPWLVGMLQIAQAVFMLVGGLLVKKIGCRATVLIGCLFHSGAILLSAGGVVLSYWVVVLLFGALSGVGTGIAQIATLDAVVQWLPGSKGLAMGVVLAAFQLTSIVFIPLQTVFVNSHNLIPDYYPPGPVSFGYFSQPEVLDLVPYLFVFMGGILFVIQILGTVLVVDNSNIEMPAGPLSCKAVLKYLWASFKPTSTCSCCNGTKLPHNHTMEMSSLDEVNIHGQNKSSALSTAVMSTGKKDQHAYWTEEVNPKELIKRWDFYLLWLSFAAATTSMIYIISMYKAFGEEFIFDDHLLAVIGSLMAVMNLIARTVFGFVADRFSAKTALVIIVGVIAVLTLNLYSSEFGGGVAYAVVLLLVSAAVGGFYTLFPICIAEWYGHNNFAANYGMLYTAQVLSAVLAILVPTLLHQYIGWAGEMLTFGALCGLSLLLLIVAGGRQIKKKH